MDNGPAATVYIVDDDASFRKSVRRLVGSFGYETQEFDSAASFLTHASFKCPGCLVLDIQMPGIDGLELQQVLENKGCLLPVVFMTGHGDIPMSVQAMKHGAVDFLPKPFEADDLRSAIVTAMERNRRDVKMDCEKKTIRTLVETLTPREKEVLVWVITGRLNKQIAEELGTTEKTIKVHRGRVMHKTGATSVAELVRLAETVGIQPAE